MGVLNDEIARDKGMITLLPLGLVDCLRVEGSINVKYISEICAGPQ